MPPYPYNPEPTHKYHDVWHVDDISWLHYMRLAEFRPIWVHLHAQGAPCTPDCRIIRRLMEPETS